MLFRIPTCGPSFLIMGSDSERKDVRGTCVYFLLLTFGNYTTFISRHLFLDRKVCSRVGNGGTVG